MYCLVLTSSLYSPDSLYFSGVEKRRHLVTKCQKKSIPIIVFLIS